jgi:hypothetical protein
MCGLKEMRVSGDFVVNDEKRDRELQFCVDNKNILLNKHSCLFMTKLVEGTCGATRSYHSAASVRQSPAAASKCLEYIAGFLDYDLYARRV